jgi:general secretion pathway protein E
MTPASSHTVERAAPPAALLPQAYAAYARHARALRTPLSALLAQELRLPAHEALARCASALRMPAFSSADLQVCQPAFDLLAFADAERLQVVLVRTAGGGLRLALDDPFDGELIDRIEARIAAPFALALTPIDEIRAYLKRHEGALRAVETELPHLARGGESEAAQVQELTLGRIAENDNPVVRLVNSLLYDALKVEASDVHLECDAHGMAIKYRVDGVLDAVGRIDDRATTEQVVSRIKVLADLDIAERRVPQDGRFLVRADARDIDLRVSIMPSVHGEDAVLRILDKKRLADEQRGLRFESLGFDAATIVRLRSLSRLPYGMLLVTGPTGSGKTTTLYAALTEVNTGRDKIVTIEDPVEYQLSGIVQIPVNEKRGLTFSRGLRSILRHDPDKIMVGEIRDGETAQIAVQAALTGHLVFTTVHANSVFDVIGRMLHIGVDPFNLVAALNGIVAQRLVRINCPHCLVEYTPDLAMLGVAERAQLEGRTLRHGRGCGHCRGTGYRGRRAIAEILALNDTLRELILARESIAEVKAAARARGLRSMREAGLALVLEGATTIDELERITFGEDADAA